MKRLFLHLGKNGFAPSQEKKSAIKSATIRKMTIVIAAFCLVAVGTFMVRPRMLTFAHSLNAKLPQSCRLMDDGIKPELCGFSWYILRGHRYDRCVTSVSTEPVPSTLGILYVNISRDPFCMKIVEAQLFAEDVFERTRNCVSELTK